MDKCKVISVLRDGVQGVEIHGATLQDAERVRVHKDGHPDGVNGVVVVLELIDQSEDFSDADFFDL